MATKYPLELVGVADGTAPRLRSDGIVVGGAVQRFRATIELAATGNGNITDADAVLLAQIPAGYVFAYGVLTSTVSLAAAQVAIGTDAAPAQNGQYRAAATATAVEEPALFGRTAAQKAEPSKAATRVYLTTSATLPTAGTVVIDIYASSAR